MTIEITDVADHYRLLMTDESARSRLLASPKDELCNVLGYVSDADYEIEIVEEHHDTITILLPARPDSEEQFDASLRDIQGRIYDILFTEGVGGYIIPDDKLKWILRDMRSAWASAGKAVPRASGT